MTLPAPGGAGLLSIVKAVNQLDKLEAMHRAALDSYSEVLRATAEYPVQVDAMEAHMYQQHIQALRQMLENVLRSEDFQTIPTSFLGELRDYRDKVNDWLDRTRGELKAAAEAMHTLSDRVAANGNSHETRLKEELEKLTSVARTADLAAIRAAIHQAAARIAASCEQMREANQFMIAQLRDEIQTLHREMDTARRTMYTDRATGVWNRQKMDSRFQELLESGDGFAAIVIWVGNLKRLDADCSRLQNQRRPEGYGAAHHFHRWLAGNGRTLDRRPVCRSSRREPGERGRHLLRNRPKALHPLRRPGERRFPYLVSPRRHGRRRPPTRRRYPQVSRQMGANDRSYSRVVEVRHAGPGVRRGRGSPHHITASVRRRRICRRKPAAAPRSAARTPHHLRTPSLSHRFSMCRTPAMPAIPCHSDRQWPQSLPNRKTWSPPASGRRPSRIRWAADY